MFSTTEIARQTNGKSFNRGIAIADRGDEINFKRFDALAYGAEFSGNVASSSGIAESFKSFVAIDESMSQIIDYGCTCPAAHKYGVMCKHCVALSIDFKRDPNQYAGFSPTRRIATSRSISKYLEGVQPGHPDAAPQSPAIITTEIDRNFDDWTVRFSILQGDASYVMSSIEDFADAFIDRKWHSYGKKLAFTHNPEAFDPGSQKIAQLISDMVQSRRDTFQTTGSIPARSMRRELHVSQAEVARLLDALDGTTFLYRDAPHLDAVPMHVVHENPDISMRIVPAEDGCYEIIRDYSFAIAIGTTSTYIMMDGIAYRCGSDFIPISRFLQDVYLSSDDELLIAQDDIASLCKTVLKPISDAMRLDKPPELDALMPTDAKMAFYLDKEGKGREERITLTVKAIYPSREITLLSPSSTPEEDRASERCYRDEDAEAFAIDMACEYFDSSMQLPLDDQEAAGRLLYEGLGRFQSIGEVLTTPDFDRLINDKKARVQIGLSITGNLINLDVQPTDVSKDELARIMASYTRKKRFHRLKNGAIASLEDLEIRQLDQLMQDFGLSASALRSSSIELPTYSAFFLDREYSEAVRDKSFEEYISRFDDIGKGTYKIQAKLAGKLRPYQVDGYEWMRKLAAAGFGGILADEMGLGKSVQLISLLEGLKEDGQLDAPALIICPASLVYNWAEEFAKFDPSMTVCTVDGLKVERNAKRRSNPDVLICSYDIARSDIDAFEKMSFSVIALDEAQYIKNHATKTSRAIRRLDATHRFALTGTPIENRLSEVWSIFDFLMPGLLGTYARFRKRYETDILGGDENAAKRLKSLVSPFVLRRLKDAVLSDLPDKQEFIVSVALNPEQQKLYAAHEQNLREDLKKQKSHRRSRKSSSALRQGEGIRVDVLAELMRLRQVSLDPSLLYSDYKGTSSKTDAILELIEEAMSAGKKALVFSQFTSYLDILEKELEKRGIGFYEITGTTPKRERIDLVKCFNEDDVPVFLVSLKAGGTGLNLVGASVVIHADPWWNLAATNQATDRAHRIGQDKNVSVYKVIARETIEERILKLQQSKEELASSIISESNGTPTSSLTRDELEMLLL